MQNLDKPDQAIKEAACHLKKNGTLFLVINHPCYRIPRQSSWGIDKLKKLQYRRVERYMTPLEIPIRTHPSKKDKSPSTYSYHFPISEIVKWLGDNQLSISRLEEWCSNKTSTGKNAKMENRSRHEFPLFLALASKKII